MRTALAFALLLIASNLMAQNTDSLTRGDSLMPIIVNAFQPQQLGFTSARIEIQLDSSTLKNLNLFQPEQLVEQIAGVDLRQRGAYGTQADLSIRGSSFEQVQVLVDGVNLSDFQTAHHSLNLPIPPFSLGAVQVLNGAAARLFGANAFAGVINFQTIEMPEQNKIQANLELGQYGLGKVEAAVFAGNSQTYGHFDLYKAVSNGYAPNTDFDITQAFFAIHRLSDNQKAKIDFRSGFGDKNLGAFNFYTPLFPYQFQKLTNLLNILTYSYTPKPNFALRLDLYHRSQYEIFELFREGQYWYHRTDSGYFVMDKDTAKFLPGVYQPWNYYKEHNFHISHLLGGKFSARYTLSRSVFYVGTSVRYQGLHSNRLGYSADTVNFPFYPGAKLPLFVSRLVVNAFANVLYRAKPWELSAGTFFTNSSQYGSHLYFGAELAYHFNHWLWFVSVNQAMREPSFTELYYQGPANVGNPQLKPEEVLAYELGFRFNHKLSLKAAAFFQQGQNIIDWVRATAEQPWTTMNYAQLNTYGFEIFAFLPVKSPWLKKILAFYRYTDQTKLQDTLLSKYTLDYLKHNLGITLENQRNAWGYLLTLHFADRNGEFELYDYQTQQFISTPYKPYLLIDLRLFYQAKNYKFYLSVDNLLNWHYYDISNVPLPGRWIKLGFSTNLNIKIHSK